MKKRKVTKDKQVPKIAKTPDDTGDNPKAESSTLPEPDSSRILIGQGRYTIASYLAQEVSSYQGHPYIEALPIIMTEDEAMEALARYPPYDESKRRTPSHLRLHMIQAALQLFVPLSVHLDLERRFSRMIRAGYMMRNPLARGFWRDLDGKVAGPGISTSAIPNCARSMPLGFFIIGFPGVGKSTSVEAILSLYPQVIYHSIYNGRAFIVAQIVWLKLECPHDGSVKGLCLNFFQAIDDLLGTNYEENYASGRRTIDELLPKMARVAAIHGIGTLVIDEIQRLSGSKSGGANRMLNFFVQLTNSIGVPVVLVGTYKAQRVLSGEFHQIRRGTGQGDLVWDRMEEDIWVKSQDEKDAQGGNDSLESKPGDWQLFLESLWPYQYTRVPCPLTEELSHVLYEETQGITDFAAKVYMLAQVRVITTAQMDEEEVLTVDVIRSVARDSLRQAQPVLAALRRGDTQALALLPDVQPVSVDNFIRQAQKAHKRRNEGAGGDHREGTPDMPEMTQGSRPAAPHSGNGSVTAIRPSPTTPDEAKSPAPPKHRQRKGPKKRKTEQVYTEGDLRDGMAKGPDAEANPYESLRRSGHIALETEFVSEEEPS